MARRLLPDGLWDLIAPPATPAARPQRRPAPARRPASAPAGILFVLRAGLPWEDLPAGLRARDGLLAAAAGLAGGRYPGPGAWGAAGAAGRRRRAGLVQVRRRPLQRAGRFWGAATGPNPTDRGGVPPAAPVSAADARDVRGLLPTGVARPLAGRGGRGRRPRRLLGRRAYGPAGHEGVLRGLGPRPRPARPGGPHGGGPGKHRWVVGRTVARVPQNRRLAVRCERRADHRQGLRTLACIRLCRLRLKR